MQRTKSGRNAEVLMQAEDAGEQVFLVKYEGEDSSNQRHLRSVKSFIFDSSSPGVDAEQIIRTSGRVMISVVGVNYDVDDGQIHDIKTCLSSIIHDVPFTLQYDHITTAAAAEEESLIITDENTDLVDPTSGEEIIEAKVDDFGGGVIESPRPDSVQLELPDLSAIASLDIVEDLKAKTPRQQILNPFGEPLSDADIQYAFDKCDENQDKRIQLKEFKKAIAGMGLDMEENEIREFFDSVDENKDKVLDFEEFRSALLNMQPNFTNIWSSWLSKSSLEMKPDKNTASIEKIAEILSNKRAPWKDRIDMMHDFTHRAVQKMSQKKFDALMRPVREPLITQLSDRRSTVVRECCIVIAKIAIVQKGKMTRWAPRILESLFTVIRLKVEIMSISATQAAKAIVRCVPDNKKLDILHKLKAASCESYIIVKQRAFEYVYLLVKDARENGVKKSKDFWLKVMHMLVNGMQDASEVVREEASLVACELYIRNEKRTESEVISKLRRATQKKFFEILKAYREEKSL